MAKRLFPILLTFLLLFSVTSTVHAVSANNITKSYSENIFNQDSSIAHTRFSAFLARYLSTDFKKTNACYKSVNKEKYVVNVAVTTLWKEPNKTRIIDGPSTSIPLDIETWTKSMTLNEKEWLVGKIESQALYGQEVTILESSDDWYQIAVKDQTTPKNKVGYPGWVPKSHIIETFHNFNDCQTVVVKTPIAALHDEPKTNSNAMDISFNTKLPIVKEELDWLHVQTPANGVKYISLKDVVKHDNHDAIPKATQKNIIDTAKMFTGLPYLWAGTSGFGMDCSGFTHSVYKQHGISIPRDSTMQAVNGIAVSSTNLQPGDLMFFSYNKGKGQVHHVSMYIGNGKMIHSPNSRKSVEIISITTEPYKSEFSGARRYLK